MTLRPLLVTGSHRSSTTWVGKVLAQTDRFLYLAEPFKPTTWWLPTTIRKKPFKNWFSYVTKEDQASFRDYMDAALGYRCPVLPELCAIRRPRDLGRIVWRRRLINSVANGSLTPLMRDPVALFSAEWLADTYDMRAVVMIRHPAAFVESIVRLNWTFDFQNLARQEALLSDLLPEYRERILRAARTQPNILDTAILQWLLAYDVVRQYQARRPEWLYVRNEDLSRDPISGFSDLCSALNLPFGETVREMVESSTKATNITDSNKPMNIMRDSKLNLKKWKQRLSAEEIRHIRLNVEELCSHFYSDDEW